MSRIYGVILAAGKGERLGRLGQFYPKPLLPVGNKPIMQHQLEDMLALGIKEYIIVVGHLKEKIIDYFGNGSRWDVKITYVEQEERLGIAHAVLQLESIINAPFVLFLGDIFMVTKNLDLLLDSFLKNSATVIVTTKREKDIANIRKNFSVLLHESGMVRRVIEKPRYIHCDRKGCGIYLFDPMIFDAIRRTPRTAMRDEYEITTAIQKIIDDGFPVYDVEAVGWDMNVTYPADLLYCNNYWLKYQQKNNIIGKTSVIHKEAVINESCIGENVIVNNPITIEHSVVFDNSLLGNDNIFNSILYEGETIFCK